MDTREYIDGLLALNQLMNDMRRMPLFTFADPSAPLAEKHADWKRPAWLRRFARWVLFPHG